MSQTDLGVYADYQVPPGTAQVAAAQAAEPTTLDQLQADAQAPEAKLPEWPEGAPELRPLMRLPWGPRAEAMELFADLQATEFPEAKKDDKVGAAEAAVMYRLFDKLDRFLLSVAADPVAYGSWPGRYDDALFSQLWAAYQARMSPGEAERSSS